MIIRRATLSALATLACGSIVGGAPAALADGGANTQITITKLTSATAKGEVNSGRASCEAERKVSLFRSDDFRSTKIATTKSNAKGIWRVSKSLKDGLYFAKVEATPGCRYDVSRNKRLGKK